MVRRKCALGLRHSSLSFERLWACVTLENLSLNVFGLTTMQRESDFKRRRAYDTAESLILNVFGLTTH